MKRALAALASLVYPSSRITGNRQRQAGSPISPAYTSDDEYRASKRRRLAKEDEEEGSRTPSLLPRDEFGLSSLCLKRQARVLRNDDDISVRTPDQQPKEEGEFGREFSKLFQAQSQLFKIVPTEVIGYCLSFLSSPSDRPALQFTCRHFRDLSNTDDILRGMKLSGDCTTGKGCFVTSLDSRETAQKRLERFVVAGNLEAYYMLGMIRAYCYDDVNGGVSLLRISSSRGHVRSSYALGLVLRDTQRDESTKMLNLAARVGFLPALQEILSAREMKARHGEPSAEVLGKYLDPIGLSKLLGEHYAHDPYIKSKHTSHCWNPLCGRWAYKQITSVGISKLLPFAIDPTTETGNPTIVGSSSEMNISSILRRTERESTFSPSPNSSNVTSPYHRENSRGGEQLDAHFLDRSGDLSTLVSASSPYPTQARTQRKQRTSKNVSHTPCHHIEKPKVSRMKMCSSCRRAKYCSKLCQVYDWRSGRHKLECQYL